MKVVYFTHSLQSCWNHGNAHFLRGVLSELAARGHEVVAYEPENAWSRVNLVADHGPAALRAWRRVYPSLEARCYGAEFPLERACDKADVIIVHEWNDPALVAALGRARARGARFLLFFHDTHHRAVSDPEAMRAYDLTGYDGVLAFGAALAETYRRWGWGERVFVWHEAADTRVFRPPAEEGERKGLVWIGNWGDGERSLELGRFLLRPARDADLPLDVHGVRYPAKAIRLLARYGARYRGWLANAAAPAAFSRRIATVHVPRRFYVTALPGIPTIRVFEALACGIPLVSAPWSDAEALFGDGDFLTAHSSAEMTRRLQMLRDDKSARTELARNGLARVRARHTCAHRADELLSICRRLRAPAVRAREALL